MALCRIQDTRTDDISLQSSWDRVHYFFDIMDEDKIVEEIEIVIAPEVNVTGSSHLLPMLLQFPLRGKDRPYAGNVSSSMEAPKIRYKYNVKRMHWDVPLDVDGPNYYDADFDERKQIGHFGLKSTRVHQGVRGMAVGFMKEGKLHLVPLQEVLQLRPSPTHLDGSGVQGKHGNSQVAVKEEEGLMGDSAKQFSSDLPLITVQIKKHETEQQTEARLRSYAFHAQQDEQDKWHDLEYLGPDSEESISIRYQIQHSTTENIREDRIIEKGRYLDYLIGTEESHAILQANYGESSRHQDDLTDVNAVQNLGAPVPRKPIDSKATAASSSRGQLCSNSVASMQILLDRLFEESAVVSVNKIRNGLLQAQMTTELKALAGSGSDDDIHACMKLFDGFVFLRHAYIRQLNGDSILDPLRSIVVDTLEEKDLVKRSDIMDMANQRGVAVTDNMYSRVMKELCISKGGSWFMKSGD